MKRYSLGFVVPLFFLLLNTIFVQTILAQLSNISGTWVSDWGKMEIIQSGSDVSGTYATSDGKLFGQINGNTLNGYWTQRTAGQRCSTKKFNSFYWGQLYFVFDQDDHFSGQWGYCGDATTQKDWTGTKQSSKKSVTDSTINPDSTKAPTDISGNWTSKWGQMQIKLSGKKVTGTYPTSNGKIFGTLEGNLLQGIWVQTSSGKKCKTQKNNSYYWGRIKFIFEDKNQFSGKWSYCESDPKRKGWTGTR